MTTQPGSSSAKSRLRHHFGFLSMVLTVSVLSLLDTNGHFVLQNIPFVCAGIGLMGMVWSGAPIIGEARWLFGAVTVLLLALPAVRQKITGSDVAFMTMLWPWACLTWVIFLAAWMDFLRRCHVFKLSTVVFLLWITGVNGRVLLCREPFALVVFIIPFGVLLFYYSTEKRYGFDGFIRVAGGTSGSDDNTIRLRDATSGKQTTVLEGHEVGHGMLAWVLIQQGRFDGALVPAEKANKLAPDNFGWAFNLGHVHLLLGDEAAAEAMYAKTIPLIPDQDAFEKGPLADFNLFIENGWQPDLCRKWRQWFIEAFTRHEAT